MRKWISIILVFTMVVMLSGAVTAIEMQQDISPVMFTTSGEQKIYSNATAEDDFADNRVMVVMSHEASMRFNAYEVADFSEIDCVTVDDVSDASGRKIEAKVEAVRSAVMNRSADAETLDTYGIDTYNQVLCIELEENSKENVLVAMDELMKRDDVIYAGPDYVISLCTTTPNDTYYGSTQNWAPNTIDLPEAWDITTGTASIVVGVLDTGIDATHPDLAANVDTTHSADFSAGGFMLGGTSDPVGHGTHVAGIIGAVGNNSTGVAGVCWNVELVSLRVFDSTKHGYSSNLANAINYAEELEIPVLNFSGGCHLNNNRYDMAIKSVIQNYAGIFVCAAGNDTENNDTNDWYCNGFNLPNMIIVGSSTSGDTKSGFSNFGQNNVDIFAPGEDILGCYPQSICDTEDCENPEIYAGGECVSRGYHILSGTSMAAPHVAGVAALLLTMYPDLLPCEIKDTIMSNVDDCGTTFDDLCVSGGRLNAYKSLTNVKRHTKTHSNLGASAGHRTSCASCGFSCVRAHDYGYASQYNALQHAYRCDCGHTIYEAHAWNVTRTKCLVCGYNANGPGILDALKPGME